MHHTRRGTVRHMSLAVTTPSPAANQPTQVLRDLIEEARYGHADDADLHHALNELEHKLGLPLTATE